MCTYFAVSHFHSMLSAIKYFQGTIFLQNLRLMYKASHAHEFSLLNLYHFGEAFIRMGERTSSQKLKSETLSV